MVGVDIKDVSAAGGTLTNSSDASYTNSAIAAEYDPHVAGYGATHVWADFYAQQFAYWSFVWSESPTSSNHATFNGIIANGWLYCTATWADDIATGTTNGGVPSHPVPDYCSSSLAAPWDYQPYQIKTH